MVPVTPDRQTRAHPTFTIITPTSGRKTLVRSVASAMPQMRDGDEIIVLRSESGDLGHGARNSAMDRAAGTHLVFLDDDDALADGGLDAARAFAAEHPGRLGIFRMRYGLHPHYPHGHVLWESPELRYSNVAGSMLVVPNIPGKVGRWNARRGGDWDFIQETVALLGEPLFREDVLEEIRPAGRLKPWALARPRLKDLDRRLGGPLGRLRAGRVRSALEEYERGLEKRSGSG
jgi:glycosyl transferase family 2